MVKNETGRDSKRNASMKHAGPILEVSTVKSGDKKPYRKIVVAASTKMPTEPPDALGQTKTDMANEKLPVQETGNGRKKMNDSFIVCSHIAERVDLETLMSVAKKHGVDLEHTREQRKVLDQELKQRIRAWKKCPCRMDFRYACRDPITGRTCPTVQALMTPQLHDPYLLAMSSRLPPGTIGVGRHQVAFHTGGPLTTTNDPHALELGRRDDGTMCVSVQYSPDPGPPPEYICTTVRETQAALEATDNQTKRSKMKTNKGKKKKGKK